MSPTHCSVIGLAARWPLRSAATTADARLSVTVVPAGVRWCAPVLPACALLCAPVLPAAALLAAALPAAVD